ncbi:guanine nucleotide exchange factor in Golgi transport N-terminal-domain-containing protein [Kockovaella imperatae]|uniref:Guanine nucleotide exchange factor in Golgi transport N-terminal-domain-containing protein n=1 Tax=Kockovaella imperatae TaxID=4999 RepID=A0A1Y1UTZ5_9TREE|nr:guanine nucleotide exchange factor in Golgi transport N-terminal-domain-containing protein [Kockovaella imperatae]ORX41097.1 guanine nucleotide exchange factor in Golgi transport N-terminal-domain-containing protein [Kockovaella imperatae]
MDHNLLVAELQTLVSESKRRYPEVKEASEAALEILKAKTTGKDTLAAHCDKLLAPVILGCKTKQAKIVGISITALQRLVILRGVATDSLPQVFESLSSVANQAVDIQLKILQTILSILSHDSDVHNEVLGNALLICFKLQDSRVSVVSSTAAASLRQAVMVIFDRIAKDTSTPLLPLTLIGPDSGEVLVTPAGLDAYHIFSDLCLLTARGTGTGSFSLWGKAEDVKPVLLKLSALQRTFGLELIESILSGYESSVKQHPELLQLLSHSLDPLLLQLLGTKPSFPIALRVCRLIFLLIRSFTEQLPLQAEAYLTALNKIGMGEVDAEEGAKRDVVPPWLRGLALEILRGICGDTALLRTIWTNFDQPENGPKIFGKIIASLGRLVNEKPALLGIGSQMHGLGIPHSEAMSTGAGTGSSGGYLDMGIGMVASAASAGITTVGSMMGTGSSGLGPQSAMKLKLIEQHDKVEAPPIPETYIYLLALQSLDVVAEGIYISVGQSNQPEMAVTGMAESAWPALLAALSYCLGTNLSDGLFAEVLSAVQDFTVACGLSNLPTPRDAFISTLGKYAVPPAVVSAMQSYMESGGAGQGGRTTSALSADSLGLGVLGSGSASPPSLSDRNLACLRSTITTARILASTLGDAWHDVLEILQNANFLLVTRKPGKPRRNPTGGSPQMPQSPMMPGTPPDQPDRSDIFGDLDIESIQNAINILFDGTRDMSDEAFRTFVNALQRLSSEMIGFDSEIQSTIDLSDASLPPNSPSMLMSPGGESKRRASGININQSIKSGERSFSLTKLRIVAMINLQRIVNSDPAIGWDPTTQHLLSVARHPSAPTTLRLQASDALDELLLGAIRVGTQSRVQHQVFNVLVKQVDTMPISNIVATDYDVRSAGYSTLNQILESSGHSLEVGWKTIFAMLNDVCKEAPAKRQPSVPYTPNLSLDTGRPSSLKGNANLVRIAFPSLNLICTDFLSSLDRGSMQHCISCLGGFGRQKEDVNIALAAIGLLWNVSDAVQGGSEELKSLWLHLLTELLGLGQDPRLEVRSTAMQTLFRCVELYGSTLPPDMWTDVLGKILFPLLDAATGDEGAILALTSTGNIFNLFLPTFTILDTFTDIYPRLLSRIERAFATEPRQCGTAGLKALERILVATGSDTASSNLEARDFILDATWNCFVNLSDCLEGSEIYTQDNLVALIRVGSQLHDQLTWTDERVARFSQVLRSVMTYDKSPEYRPDTDVMSPLQASITQLICASSHLGSTIVLGDLAEFASLAYIRDEAARVTFVAVSKFSLPKIAEVFQRSAQEQTIFEDGTVESVLGAYAVPIKLKYDCPSANKYGEDGPLWKTAMESVARVLDPIVFTIDTSNLDPGRISGIWSQIIDIFSAVLLADNSNGGDQVSEDESFVLPFLDRLKGTIVPRLATQVPDHLIERYGDVLRRASELYRFDVKTINGGTTAPAVPDVLESTRFWAFDLLWAGVGMSDPGAQGDDAKVAKLVLPSLLRRAEKALRGYVDDAKLRGQMPLGRVRDDELLYILRHLATLKIVPNVVVNSKAHSFGSSTRAHLFHFYPLFLELAFLRSPLPSMWLFPSERSTLYEQQSPTADQANGEFKSSAPGKGDGGVDQSEMQGLDAGDGGELIEVGAREIARRCLELIGQEMGISTV